MARALAESPRKKVGIWIRVSTEDQAQGESPEHHEKRARAYAESKDWDVVTKYDLAGVGGQRVGEHPECRRMMTDIQNGTITGLIFSKLARLARNTKQLLEFADYFRAHDADMVSLADSIDTSTPAGRLFYTMNAAVAQWEREEIADRIAATIPIRAKLGKSFGGTPPFGYQWVDKKLAINEQEAPIRRRLYELFAEHKRKKTVAALLNKAGYRMRGGKLFTDTTVNRLLIDSCAVGTRRINYTTTGTHGRGIKPVSEWADVAVPAIVSVELWDTCQAILKAQTRVTAKPAKKTVHLFSGVLFCQCGKKMYVPWKGLAYTCPGCRNRVGIDDLEVVFNSQLTSFFFSSAQIATHLEQADEQITSKQSLLTSLQTERSKVSTEMDKLYRLYQDDNISGAQFKARSQSMEERLLQLDDEVPRLAGELDYQRMQLMSSDEIVTEAQDLHTRWTSLSFDEKRVIIENITERITVSDNEIDIKLVYLPQPSGTSGEHEAKRQRPV